MEKTSVIKEKLQAASFDELPSFISEFESDERKAVQNLVLSAKKKLDACRLARPAASDDEDKLALADLKRKILDGMKTVNVVFCNVFTKDDRRVDVLGLRPV